MYCLNALQKVQLATITLKIMKQKHRENAQYKNVTLQENPKYLLTALYKFIKLIYCAGVFSSCPHI